MPTALLNLRFSTLFGGTHHESGVCAWCGDGIKAGSLGVYLQAKPRKNASNKIEKYCPRCSDFLAAYANYLDVGKLRQPNLWMWLNFVKANTTQNNNNNSTHVTEIIPRAAREEIADHLFSRGMCLFLFFF